MDLAEGSLLLLDACCLINLFATGRMEEILQRLPHRFATSRLVLEREVLCIAKPGERQSPMEREAIPRSQLEASEHLAILDLATDEEIDRFVRFAVDLDEGEASVCALAVVRGGGVATDDRKALRLLGQTMPPVATVQTPQILWEWAMLSRIPDDEVCQLLQAVEQRAQFSPRKTAPKADWWNSFR